MPFYMRVLISIILLMCWCQFVFAEDYYWKRNHSVLTGSGPDPAALCTELIGTTYNGTLTDAVPTRESDVSWNCALYRYTGTFYQNLKIIRLGDTCSTDTTFNTDTGKCEGPVQNECEEKAGTEDFYSKSGDMGDGYTSSIIVSGKTYIASPQSGCMNGCTVNVTTDCKNRIGTNFYRCSGPATYTGESCTATDGSPQLEQEENYVPDEPQNTELTEPCVYQYDAEGRRQECVSKASLDQEGQNCGEYNGESLCVPKQAEFDEKTVQTEITESDNSDGGTTTVKKDTATVTSCTGSSSDCTTTTTTTITTTNSDGTGTTTSTSVECKGSDCGSGVGDASTGADYGSDEDEEDDSGELEGQDDVAGFGESIQDFNSRISGSPILSTVSAISMPSGGSCSMGSASVPLLGSISFNWVCENASLLDPLYYVMLAMWAIGAVRIFLEA